MTERDILSALEHLKIEIYFHSKEMLMRKQLLVLLNNDFFTDNFWLVRLVE